MKNGYNYYIVHTGNNKAEQVSNDASRQVIIEIFFEKKLMINAITCSMLESLSTSDYDVIENCVYKSTDLDPRINT